VVGCGEGFFIIYIMHFLYNGSVVTVVPVIALFPAVIALLATLTPTPSPLAVPKSYCFSSHLFSGVILFAYWFRRLAYVI